MTDSVDAQPERTPLLKHLLIGLAIVGIYTAIVVSRSGTAPLPEAFDPEMTLVNALDHSAAEDRVIFAVVTADWCGPCQGYKRGALADEEVRAWLDANAIAVMVDATDGLERNESLLLKDPKTIPITALFRDGRLVNAFEGKMGAKNLLGWLEANTGG